MLRLLIDQDINHQILRGLRERIPDLDFVTVREIGMSAAPDAWHLAWAANENRIILTHDVNTFSKYAYERIESGEKVVGVIIIPQSMAVGEAVNELEIIVLCSSTSEYENQVIFLPHLN